MPVMGVLNALNRSLILIHYKPYIKGLLTESEVCTGFRTDRATKERGLCG